MNFKNLLRTATIATAVVLAALLAAACEDREPQDVAFEMEIVGGELTGGESTLTVNQGDTVTIDWTSDLPLLVHLHGYNIEAQVGPGETAPMNFEAHATGRYDIFIHAAEGVLTADSGMDDMDDMDDMGSMDSPSDSSSTDHTDHVTTDTAGTSVRERLIATLEVRP